MESADKTEILEAISLLADQVQGFQTKTESRFDAIDVRFSKIEAIMVTKPYLDDKLADLKGDMVAMLRKEDQKTTLLVERLTKRHALTASDAKDVLAVRPFAR